MPERENADDTALGQLLPSYLVADFVRDPHSVADGEKKCMVDALQARVSRACACSTEPHNANAVNILSSKLAQTLAFPDRDTWEASKPHPA